MSQYLRWICRHAVAVVSIVAVATIALAFGIADLEVEVDPDSQLPQDHPYIRALRRLNETFGEKNLVLIGLFPTEGSIYTPEFLRKLDAITNRVGALPGIVEKSFASLTLEKIADIRPTEDGMAVEPMVGALPSTRAEALRVRERLERNPHFLGILAANDGSAAAITADFRLQPPLVGYPEIRSALETIVAEENDGSFTAHLGGPVIYVAWLAYYSERMFLFLPLALLVIAIVHYEAFRTPQAMILPLLTALLSMVWSLGLLGVLGVRLDPFNVTTPILILAVAAGHAVQMLKRYYEELDRGVTSREAVVAAGEAIGPVMLVATGIAAASFLSLLSFQTTAIRNFGLFTALGILSALVIEMTLIPAVRVLLPDPGERERSRERARHAIDRVTERLADLVTRAPGGVLVGAALIAAVAAMSMTALRVDSSFQQQFVSTAQVRRDDVALNAAFGGTSTLVLLVDGGSESAIDDPAMLEAIARVQAWLEEQPSVGKTLSVVDFIGRMHFALGGEGIAPTRAIPRSRELVAQYWLLYSLSGGQDDFGSIIDEPHRTTALRAFLHDDRTEIAADLISRLQAVLARELPGRARVEISGSLASSYAMNEVMVHGKIRNVLQIAALIVVVSALVLRSLVAGLLVALPLAFAVLTNFAAMALLDIPLDIGTSAISAMAVGIGADYAIYFLFRLREELRGGTGLEASMRRALTTSGKAILFVSSAIAAGYLTLCFSGFGYHVRLGTLVAFAMIVSSLASLSVLPAAILRLRPRFLTEAAGGEALRDVAAG